MRTATDRTWPAGVAPGQMLGRGRLGELCLAEAKRVTRRRRTRSDVVVRPEWTETTRLVPVADEVATLRHCPLSIVEGDIPTAPLPPVIDSQQDVITLPLPRSEPPPRPTRQASFRRSAARVPHSWVGPLVDEDDEAITTPLPEPPPDPVAARSAAVPFREPMPRIATLLSSTVTDLCISVSDKPFDLEAAIESVRYMPVVDAEHAWPPAEPERPPPERPPPEPPPPEPPPQAPAGTQVVNVFVAVAVIGLVAFAAWSIFADPSQRAAVMALLGRLGVH